MDEEDDPDSPYPGADATTENEEPWMVFTREELDTSTAFGAALPRLPRTAFQFAFQVRKVRFDHSAFWANPEVGWCLTVVERLAS